MWTGGCGNRSGVRVCVVSLNFAVLCPRLWISWKHFATSCIFFFFFFNKSNWKAYRLLWNGGK